VTAHGGGQAPALQEAVSQIVLDDVAPGCAACVVTGDGRRFTLTPGRLHRGPAAGPINDDTIWDLASLTKLLSTTYLASLAVEKQLLRLDETPWRNWNGVTVEHALRHSAGLPSWKPLFEEARKKGAVGLPAAKQIVLDAARAVSLEAEPGSKTVYSDIGFIALGALLEERFEKPLDELFAQLCVPAFGATTLGYVRLDRDGFHPALPNVAPTERCLWRRRAMHGQVHDENCFAMGGVSGHAGLFGTLSDVERAGLFLLRAIKSDTTLAKWAKEDGHARGIGFDRATKGGSTGDVLSSSTVGHLGFTGTSLWIDPSGVGAVYVLLTNRIHESREGPHRILEARQRFHRAAAQWVSAT
jgi:serine-type D-Ala-D-Ala carboxypeptidase